MFLNLILLSLASAQNGQAIPESSLQFVDTGFDRALFEIADLEALRDKLSGLPHRLEVEETV